MEWHLFRTIVASFLAVFGFLMDLQSLFGGLRAIRKGRGPKGVLVWPFLCYVAAALVCDGDQTFRLMAIGAGLLFHLISTVVLRWIARLYNG